MTPDYDNWVREIDASREITVELSLNLSMEGVHSEDSLAGFKLLKPPYIEWITQALKSGQDAYPHNSERTNWHATPVEIEVEPDVEDGENVEEWPDHIWGDRQETRYEIFGPNDESGFSLDNAKVFFLAAIRLRELTLSWQTAQDVEGLYVTVDYSAMAIKLMCAGYVMEMIGDTVMEPPVITDWSMMLIDTFALGPTSGDYFEIVVSGRSDRYLFKVHSDAGLMDVQGEKAHEEWLKQPFASFFEIDRTFLKWRSLHQGWKDVP